MLNANAAVFVPKPIAPPPPAGAATTGSATLLDASPAGDAPAVERAPSTADAASTDDFDADFEEVLNALDELQESQIHQEVEEQLMHELEMYATDYDEFLDDEDEQLELGHVPVAPTNSHPPPPPFPRQRSGGAPRCKFAPTCRDGSRRCRFSHQHMGACKFGTGCTNPTCNYLH